MKPCIFDRFLLVLCCLAGMAAGVALLLLAAGLFPYWGAFIDAFLANRWLMGGAGLVVFLISLRLIIGFNKRAKKDASQKNAPATTALISTGDFGSTQITLAALDSMIQRHCRTNPKVRETGSMIRTVDGGIAIELKLVLIHDANIPETTASLQKSLKEYLEGLTGIKVNDISILVVTAPPQKAAQK